MWNPRVIELVPCHTALSMSLWRHTSHPGTMLRQIAIFLSPPPPPFTQHSFPWQNQNFLCRGYVLPTTVTGLPYVQASRVISTEILKQNPTASCCPQAGRSTSNILFASAQQARNVQDRRQPCRTDFDTSYKSHKV